MANSPAKRIKVMTFGAFDIIHDGHRSLFRQAKAFGGRNSKLLVVVASDARIKKIKGKAPWFSQKERMEHLKKEPLIDQVIGGDRLNTLKPILEYGPEIIVFGYDQPLAPEELDAMLMKKGFFARKIVRARAYKPHLCKSSIIKQKKGKKYN
ncbi:MAG: adenylyltransferase/cytidyltransferase family protein [Candidatus Micrarchaeota archaeon]